MTPKENQQKIENLRAVAALAPLVTALYGANETVALNTVTNTIREALAPMLTMSLEDDGAIKPGPAIDGVGAGKTYIQPEGDMDVVITLNGQRATGKTVLAAKITNLLRDQGFDVTMNDTDGTVEILRVLDPAKAFRKPQAEAAQATGKPPCTCAGCRMNRGEPVTDAEKDAVLQYERLIETLTRGRVFTFGG